MAKKINNIAILRIIIFIIAIGITVLFLPRDKANKYNYVVNRPWAYTLLTAPYDIPIYLDSITSKAVIDSLNHNFEPIIKRNAEIEKAVVDRFADSLNNSPNIDLNRTEIRKLKEQLEKEYAVGIMNEDLKDLVESGQINTVRIIKDNIITSIPVSDLITRNQAFDQIYNLFYDFSDTINSSNLFSYLEPSISIDSVQSKKYYDDAMQIALAPRGVIQQGQKIIDKGDIVTLQLFTILQTYEKMEAEKGEETTRENYYVLIGQIIYLLLLFSALYGFLYYSRPKYFKSLKTITMIILLIVAFLITTFLLAKTANTWLYIIPYTIIPIVLVVFLDARTAFFSHLITVLGAMLISLFPMEFIFCQFMAGVVAINSIRELSKRSQLIKSAVFVFIAYGASFFAVELLHNWSFEKISWIEFGYFGINIVLISFAYIFIFLLEKLFGYTSTVTLVELSDINHPLLKKLSEECPGTFQHSMAVSNLASAAADKIGANSQLVRSGALYHDIGKIDNPAFFTENQHGVNPHDGLDPLQSARIIIGHINNGLRRAEKEKLPPVIKDFIAQHHGNGKARYFYNTWCNNHPDEEPDEKAFTYPGPNPTTREASILMMADAVEAASRSLKEPTPQAITGLVNKIIDSQVAEGLHNDSPLSFRDIQNIKNVFISRLQTMYHSRISYPELNKNKAL